METLLVNLNGKVRRATLNNREYLVASATLIVPGVLNGSKGSLLYEASEIEKSVNQWNNIPLVLDHPNVNGQHVSARDPDILDKSGIGMVMKADVSSNGSLTGEAWFDVEAVKRVDNRILTLLNAGKPIELSTGLFTRNDPAEEGATHNGRPYQFIARQYVPDHLAILPNGIGACAVTDGCGVNVLVNGLSHNDLSEQLRTKLQAKFDTSPESGAVASYPTGLYIQDVFDDRVVYSKDGETYQIGYKMLEGSVDFGLNTPVKVKRITDYAPVSNEGQGYLKQLWRWLTLGGYSDKPIANDQSEQSGPEKVIKTEKRECDCGGKCDECKSMMTENLSVDEICDKVLNAAVNQPRCPESGHYQPNGSGTGKGEPHASAKKGFKGEGEEDDSHSPAKLFVNQDGQPGASDNHEKENAMPEVKLTDNEHKKLVDEIVLDCECTEDEAAVVNAFPPGLLAKFAKKKKKADPEDEEEEDDEDEEMPPKGMKKKMAANREVPPEPKPSSRRRKTADEWFNEAPPEIQSAVRNAMDIEANEKKSIIEHLTANIDDDADREKVANRLNGKSLYELRDLSILVPKREEATSIASFFGAAAPAVNRRQSDADKNDILPLPTMNWSDEKAAV